MADQAFDPDKYIEEKTQKVAATSATFDPDKYIEQKSAALGIKPEAKDDYYGPVSITPDNRPISERLASIPGQVGNDLAHLPQTVGQAALKTADMAGRALDWLPGTVRMAGGRIAAEAMGKPDPFTIDDEKSALVGKAPGVGEILKRLGAPEMGSIEIPQQDVGPIHTPNVKVTGRDALGVAGDVASQLGVSGFAKKAIPGIADALNFSKANEKPGVKDIEAASNRLGFDATPGMRSGSQSVQNAESMLGTSPTIAGHMVDNSIMPVRQGLQDAAQDVVSSAGGMSKAQAGRSMADSVTADLGIQHGAVQMAYEPFNKELPKMVPDEPSLLKVANQISKTGGTSLSLGQNVEGFAGKVADQVLDARNLNDVEETRKQVATAAQNAFQAGDHNAGISLSKIEDHLSDFRDNQFVSLAKQNGNPALGEQMVQEYQQAQGLHSQMMTDLKDIGGVLGIKAKNPRSFIEAASQIKPEQMADKLFKSASIEDLEKAQKYFPEAFEQARQLKISQIKEAASAVDSRTGLEVVDPRRLVREVDKLSPESQQILFGNKAQKIEDMRTVLNSLPKDVNPSGTARTEAMKATDLQNIPDIINYLKYKAASSPGFNQGVGNAGMLGVANQPPVMSTTIRKRDDLGKTSLPSRSK